MARMVDDPRRTTARGKDLPHGADHVVLHPDRPLTVDEIRVMVRDHHRRIGTIEQERKLEASEREASHESLLESVKAYVHQAMTPVVKGLEDVANFVREARDEKRALVVLEESRAKDESRLDKLYGRRKDARQYGLMTYAIFTAPTVAVLCAVVAMMSAHCGK